MNRRYFLKKLSVAAAFSIVFFQDGKRALAQMIPFSFFRDFLISKGRLRTSQYALVIPAPGGAKMLRTSQVGMIVAAPGGAQMLRTSQIAIIVIASS